MRRWLRFGLGLLTIAVILAVCLHPAIYWPALGWWRGEAFYQERPTSFWAEQLKEFDTPTGLRSLLLGTTIRPYLTTEPPVEQLRSGQPNAVAVLVELLQHPDPAVRYQALTSLLLTDKFLQPFPRSAIPLLDQLLQDPAEGRRGERIRAMAAVVSQRTGSMSKPMQVP
jgi:hypothetical protein